MAVKGHLSKSKRVNVFGVRIPNNVTDMVYKKGSIKEYSNNLQRIAVLSTKLQGY